MGIALPVSTTIRTADWINEEAYPSYYANRDVTKRMNKPHLKGGIKSSTQCLVSCAEFEGVRIKLDGHSRAEAWRRGQLEMPEELTLMVYKVECLEDMATLYRSFNSTATAESPTEYMYHINKLTKFEPTSKFVKKSWKYPFGLLGFKDNEQGAINTYREELMILDSWDLTDKRGDTTLGTPIKAALLKTLKQDREKALTFWDVYLDKTNNSVAEVNRIREGLLNGLSGAVAVGMVYAIAIGAFQSYIDKR